MRTSEYLQKWLLDGGCVRVTDNGFFIDPSHILMISVRDEDEWGVANECRSRFIAERISDFIGWKTAPISLSFSPEENSQNVLDMFIHYIEGKLDILVSDNYKRSDGKIAYDGFGSEKGVYRDG